MDIRCEGEKFLSVAKRRGKKKKKKNGTEESSRAQTSGDYPTIPSICD